MAAENGHTAVVEILVKAGADVNNVSHVGCGEVLTSRRRLDPNTLYSFSLINGKLYGSALVANSIESQQNQRYYTKIISIFIWDSVQAESPFWLVFQVFKFFDFP